MEALLALWDGAFGSSYALWSATLVRATPLLFVGLAVAVAFRANVLNIGAEGQLLVGAMLASVVGYAALDGASKDVVAAIQGFAAGALLVMLVDTMIPDATRRAGGTTGLFTTLGFAVAALISYAG